MNFQALVKPSVLLQPVYEPGKPIENVARELNLDPATIIKLASNENPFGPSPKAVAAGKSALEHGELYPDGGCFVLREKLAAARGLNADQFIVGHGSNEIIELLAFARSVPDHVMVVFDEAYAEYVENAPDLRPLLNEGRPVICLRTFSKIYGLASLRVGYGYASAEVATLLNRVRQPFNVNAIAQAAAVAALDDREFTESCARENRRGLAQLAAGFDRLGLECVPSVANFMLVKVGDGARIFETLQRKGVIVRTMKPYGMAEWIRVTIGTTTQNERFLAELAPACGR